MENNLKIIVNADDFGMSHEKNIAIDNLMRRGICTNASLVVNMPTTQEAVKLSYEGGYADKISLHLNLTVGRALSDEIKKIPLYYDKDKFAYRPIIKINEQVYPKYIKTIQEELEMQIKQFLSYGYELRNIDSHNWVHLRLPVWLALKPLIKKYKIRIVRPMWEGYKKPNIASVKWSKYFTAFQPLLLCYKPCRIVEHSSNIEQFVLNAERLRKKKYVEVFTHPDIIDGKIMDISSSYIGKERESVEKNVDMLREYKKISIIQILEEMENE